VDDAFSNIINSLLWLPVPFAARTCKRYLLMTGLFSEDSQKYSENKSAFKFNVYLRICSNTPRRRLELYPRPVRPTKVNDTFYSFLPHDAVLCCHIVSRTRTGRGRGRRLSTWIPVPTPWGQRDRPSIYFLGLRTANVESDFGLSARLPGICLMSDTEENVITRHTLVRNDCLG